VWYTIINNYVHITLRTPWRDLCRINSWHVGKLRRSRNAKIGFMFYHKKNYYLYRYKVKKEKGKAVTLYYNTCMYKN
jgi:hypothetical protein